MITTAMKLSCTGVRKTKPSLPKFLNFPAARRTAVRVEVVTSDRDLAAEARRRGATVTGARLFLDRLDAAGC